MTECKRGKVWAVCGKRCSGKTTYTQELVTNLDDFTFVLTNDEHTQEQWEKFVKSDETRSVVVIRDPSTVFVKWLANQSVNIVIDGACHRSTLWKAGTELAMTMRHIKLRNLYLVAQLIEPCLRELLDTLCFIGNLSSRNKKLTLDPQMEIRYIPSRPNLADSDSEETQTVET